MCEHCEYEQFLDEIKAMRDDDRYGSTEERLAAIYEWVNENEHITEKQVAAVEHIQRAIKSKRQA